MAVIKHPVDAKSYASFPDYGSSVYFYKMGPDEQIIQYDKNGLTSVYIKIGPHFILVNNFSTQFSSPKGINTVLALKYSQNKTDPPEMKVIQRHPRKESKKRRKVRFKILTSSSSNTTTPSSSEAAPVEKKISPPDTTFNVQKSPPIRRRSISQLFKKLRLRGKKKDKP